MSETPNLGLPLLAAGQAQKHVTHNEALGAIDALLHLAVRDKDLATPPAGPGAGDRYIVAASPGGAWAGRAGSVAIWQDGAWSFVTPRRGMLAFVADEALLYVYTDPAWTSLTAGLASIQNLGMLGLGTNADATNRFAAKLNTALWTARTSGEGGTGDLRYTLNKEAAANTLSLLFQSGYSGRLELGLIGSDHPALKVSPDGTTWRTALAVNGSTGGLDFLSSSTDLASAATCDIGAVPTRKVGITGGTTITSFGAVPHCERLIRFQDAVTVAHDAIALKLPGGSAIATLPGDCAYATSDASGRWTVRHYQRVDGTALVLSPHIALSLANASLGIGYQALRTAATGGLTGNYNAAFGHQSLSSITTGSFCTALGYAALYAMTTGSQNTALGSRALAALATGSYNTAVGEFAMNASVTASRCTAVGLAALYATDYGNCTGLGAGATVSGNDQVQLGDSATTTYVYGTVQNRSDARDKADIRDTILGLDFVLALRPVDYRLDVREDYRALRPVPPPDDAPGAREAHAAEVAAWSEANALGALTHDGTRKRRRYHHGLIAQEVRATLDRLGIDFGGFQDHGVNGGDDVLSLGYDEFVGPLIKSVQELAAMNRALAERVDRLVARNAG